MQIIFNFKRILAIFTKMERKKFRWLFIMMIIGMILETFSIAIIIPFIDILVNTEQYIEKYPIIINIINFIGNPNQNSIIYYALAIFILLYLIKNLFLLLLVWKLSIFSTEAIGNLSNRLFQLYLNQPYTFHLQYNSSKLIRNITTEVGIFSSTGFNSMSLLISEFFVLFGIITLLLILQPITTLVAIGIMGGVGILFHFITKKRVIKWGKYRQIEEEQRLKCIQEGLSGIKITKLKNCENYFSTLYSKHTLNSFSYNQKQGFTNNIPKYLIEIITMIILSSIIIVILIQDNSTENIMPTITLFSMAAFRLMPSFNRIMLSIQNLKFGKPTIDLIYNDLLNLDTTEIYKKKKRKKNIFNNEISIKNLYFKYSLNSKNILKNISLSIQKGQTIGFIGESGSGKSTLADIILGLLRASSGDILVDNKSISTMLSQWQEEIGYVPQDIYLTDDSLRKNIAFGIKEELIDDKQIWKVLNMAQLDDFVKENPEGLNLFVGERGVKLSGGQQQRIGIARALYHNPSVLILDEATSALDNETEIKIMKTIAMLRHEKTILIIAHRLTTLENCDYIYKFKNGEIIDSGIPQDIIHKDLK